MWAGDQMIVWGGDDGGDQVTRREYVDGAAYFPTTGTWRLLPAAPTRAPERPGDVLDRLRSPGLRRAHTRT